MIPPGKRSAVSEQARRAGADALKKAAALHLAEMGANPCS